MTARLQLRKNSEVLSITLQGWAGVCRWRFRPWRQLDGNGPKENIRLVPKGTVGNNTRRRCKHGDVVVHFVLARRRDRAQRFGLVGVLRRRYRGRRNRQKRSMV